MLLLLSLLSTVAYAIIVTGPSGPWSVSHKVVALTDESRWDPYAPEDNQHKRHILTSIFVPSHLNQTECDVEQMSYLPPKTAEAFVGTVTALGLPKDILEDYELKFCKLSSHNSQPLPVAIFSPGFGASRLLYSAQAQSLASQGNVVITIDHPYEASIVEFPDGTVTYAATGDNVDVAVVERALKVRTKDVSFLMDSLSKLNPALGGRIDTSKIFLFGHSLGGATSAQTALEDARVAGGLNFDGAWYGSVAEAGLDVPFFLVTRNPTNKTTTSGLLDKFRGPKMQLDIVGTEHLTFSDMPLLFSLSDRIPAEAWPAIAATVGTIDGKTFSKITDAVLGMATKFVFENKGQSLCHLEDRYCEVKIVERDLKEACA